jgi:hypothetical protein
VGSLFGWGGGMQFGWGCWNAHYQTQVGLRNTSLQYNTNIRNIQMHLQIEIYVFLSFPPQSRHCKKKHILNLIWARNVEVILQQTIEQFGFCCSRFSDPTDTRFQNYTDMSNTPSAIALPYSISPRHQLDEMEM